VFALSQRPWWDALNLSPTEKLRARQDLATIDHFGSLVVEAETELARLSGRDPWAEMLPWLIQLPGMGLITAMTVLSAIGDISRFPSAKHLVGYSGLGAKVHASGQTHWSGGITKQGRVELRAALIEAAWAAVRHSPHWRQHYERLAQRIGEGKAIVAIARKLLVVIWHVLSAQAPDRHADTPAVARRLLRWGASHRLASGLGLSRAAFVRQQLDRLGLGHDLESITYNGVVIKLPSGDQGPGGAAAAGAAGQSGRTGMPD
jgi:hypothetical protein